MGYLNLPGRQYGGYASKFGAGMANPNFGGQSVRRPTGRVPAGEAAGGGIATVYSGAPAEDPFAVGNQAWREYQARKKQGPTRTGYGMGTYSKNKGGSGFVWDKNYEHAAFNEPDIPGMRDLGGVERYTGERWAPSKEYESSVVDTGALIDATDALLQERMGGEMAEAARRFGQAGALMSGGGLGGGYAGTLGESERGYRRDLGEATHRYRFQAEQADAQRQMEAYNAAMNRELSAHEGYEGRRFADVNMANQYGLSAFDRMTDYDWDRYGAELGRAEREQADAIAEMLASYGG